MIHSSHSLVSLENASRFYEQGDVTVRALDSINLRIKAGEFTALCGPSGSGKTTLLNLIGALDSPTSGQVFVDGQNLSELSKSERSEFRLNHVGFVFQAYNLISVFSAIENVEYLMHLQGVPASERKQRAANALKNVGLSGLENRKPSELSGGQQQRVAVARAIVGQPKLILADEPTANLDSKTAESLLELMSEMNRNLSITFIFSTHDQLVMKNARRLIQLHDGKVVSDSEQETTSVSQNRH